MLPLNVLELLSAPVISVPAPVPVITAGTDVDV